MFEIVKDNFKMGNFFPQLTQYSEENQASKLIKILLPPKLKWFLPKRPVSFLMIFSKQI